MPFYESKSANKLRKFRQQKRYPELEGSSFDEIAEVDQWSRNRGEPVSSFGRDVETASSRIGLTEEDQFDLSQRFGRRPPVIPEFATPEPDVLSPLDQAIYQSSYQAQERQRGSDIFAGNETLAPGLLDAVEAESRPQFEEYVPPPPSLMDRFIGSNKRAFIETVKDLTDGEEFINLLVNDFTFQPVRGSEEFDIREQDWYESKPEIMQEIVRALAPINFAAAGEGSLAVTAALKTAAAAEGRSAASRRALLGLASVVEPFANQSVGGRLAREIAVDVAAQEGFRRTEGAPGVVRFGAGLAAGAAAGAATDPRVIGGAVDAAASGARAVNALPDESAIRAADPTALTRELSTQTTPLSQTARRLAAEGRAPVSGAEDFARSPLDSARDALKRAYREESVMRGRGVPQEELRAGRVQQFASVDEAMAAGREMGLVGEDLTAFARSGAQVEGTIRQTFAQPLDLAQPQRDALFDEVGRMLRDGEIDTPTYLSTTTAVGRLIDGEGLRGFELGLTENKNTANALRNLIGEDAFSQVVARGPRVSLDRADAAIRRETDRFIEQAQRAQQRAAEQQARNDLKYLDAQIKALEEPIDITTGTGARAILANPDVEDVARARREVETLANRAETRAIRAEDRTRLRELDNQIKALESKYEGEIRAFDRADAAEITRIRKEIAQIEERNTRGALRAAERESVQQVDARIRQLEREIRQEIRAFNDADAALRRETDRYNQAAVRRQANARTSAEAAAYKRMHNARVALETRIPNQNVLLQRAGEIMDRPITGTPRGEIPRGETGKVIGDRLLPEMPRVPVEIRQDVYETIANWLVGSDAILKSMSDEELPLINSVRAQITGDLDSPFLTATVRQRNTLISALRATGVEDRTAREIATALMNESLARRYGDSFSRLRVERTRIEREVRAELRRAAGLQDPPDMKPEAIRALTDQRMDERFADIYGRTALAKERYVQDQFDLLNETSDLLRGLGEASQVFKNTMFGLDFGVLGVNIPAAIYRGGVPMMAKMVNDTLAVLHLPHVRYMYTEGNLGKQINYMLDGVQQSGLESSFRRDSKSILHFIPFAGEAIDEQYLRMTDWLSRIQFGTIMTAVRNSAYEGNLVIARIAGQDISDPLVRRAAAANANMIGSTADLALRGKRAEFEAAFATSARMNRARFNHLTQAFKLIEPKASMAERVFGATTIASWMFTTMVMGKALNDIFGSTEYQMDPSKPGFGQITLAGEDGEPGRVINLVPQQAVVRAFARSLRILAEEQDPGAASQEWLKVYLGSSSYIGRVPPALVDTGYEPGAGYRIGDMTTRGQILSLLPLPPTAQSLLLEGYDALGVALDTAGVGNWEENTYSEGDRALRDAGLDPDSMTTTKRREELAHLGILESIEERTEEQVREMADRGDPTAKARLVSYDERDELNRIYEDSTTKAEYRERRGRVVPIYVGRRSEYDGVFRGWAESDNEYERLASERWALKDEVTRGVEVDWDRLEELQAQFDANLDPTTREQVYAIVNAVDPRDNVWEQEYSELRVELADAGWWDLSDNLWAQTFGNSPYGEGAESLYEWKQIVARQIEQEMRNSGLPPGRAREQAMEEVNKIGLVTQFEEMLRTERLDWMRRSDRNIELADQALEWGIWSNAPEAAEKLIDAALR